MLHFTLQRQAHLRRSDDELNTLRTQAKVLLFVADKIACQNDVLFVTDAHILTQHSTQPQIFLGCYPEPLFALQLPEQHDFPVSDLRDLRHFAAFAKSEQIAQVFFAAALFTWRAKHSYCSQCGGLNVFQAGGHEAQCSQCGTLHFPRTDPAIIVAVTDGDKILLGRQAGWPAKRFSVLAGFVEPGESLEQACAREVLEESGVLIKNARYFSSQPWPFPLSLMLAFFAEAASNRIELSDHELEQALWVSPDELQRAVHNGDIVLPPSASVARQLLRHWYEVEHKRDLQSLVSPSASP